jgi:hypothetical protein
MVLEEIAILADRHDGLSARPLQPRNPVSMPVFTLAGMPSARIATSV